MAENVTFAPLTSIQNDTTAVATINANFQLAATAFTDVLSRTGISPNQMQYNLDVNSNQILNLPPPATVNSPVRLQDVINPAVSLTVPPVGTSGAVVPLLNGNNTWSGTNAFGSITGTTTTQAIGTNNTALADTAFVRKELYYVNVLDFGADNTGTTNSLTAIQNAINAVSAGGTVIFPAGSYLITGIVNIVGSKISLIGEDSNVTILNGNTNAEVFFFGDGVNTYFSNSIKGFTFLSASGVSAIVGQYGLLFSHQGQGRIEDLRFSNAAQPLSIGLVLDTCSQIQGQGIQINNCLSYGMWFLNSSDISLNNVRSDFNGSSGYLFNGSQGLYLNNINGFGNTGHAFTFETGSGNTHNFNIFISNAVGDSSGQDNWNLADISVFLFVNVWASTQKSPAVNVFANGFLLQSSNVFDGVIVNPVALYNNFAGFETFSSGGSPTNISIINPLFGNAVHPNGQGGSGGYGALLAGAGSCSFIGGSMTHNTTTQLNNTSTGAVVVSNVSGVASFNTNFVPNTQTGSYVQSLTDNSIIFNAAGSSTLTLLSPATVPGCSLYVKTITSQAVVSASSNVVPITTATPGTSILAGTAGKWALLVSDGTNWIITASN